MFLRKRRGFTLIELLVVIAIIGTLVALLLPAVQMARESGRKTACLNNLKQLANACAQHESKLGYFPTGGWGGDWVGLPTRGVTPKQPGGWIYNILPYIEQKDLRDLGMPGTIPNDPDDRLALGSALRLKTPAAGLICPSRRRADLFEVLPERQNPRETTGPITQMAQTDYAANGGSFVFVDSGGGPESLDEADSYSWPADLAKCNGIIYTRSEVLPAHIRDGLSNTYLVGEKYIDPRFYEGVTTAEGNTNPEDDPGDDFSAFSGDVNDTIRFTAGRARRDVEGEIKDLQFGSAHSSGWHGALCDGSARMFRFNMDPNVHTSLGTRAGGEPIDQSRIR